jgi:PIN domain nuclease of toxin-antitoxin system
MNCLLDTHVLLWWLNDDQPLSTKSIATISNGRNVIFVSAVTIWEIQIKHAIGKLELPDNFRDSLQQGSFEYLDVTPTHAFAVGQLPMHHRDPFGRMLIAQAQVENLTIITRDAQFQHYSVSLIEA